jgi:hypothetical protein
MAIKIKKNQSRIYKKLFLATIQPLKGPQTNRKPGGLIFLQAHQLTLGNSAA